MKIDTYIYLHIYIFIPWECLHVTLSHTHVTLSHKHAPLTHTHVTHTHTYLHTRPWPCSFSPTEMNSFEIDQSPVVMPLQTPHPCPFRAPPAYVHKFVYIIKLIYIPQCVCVDNMQMSANTTSVSFLSPSYVSVYIYVYI